MHLLDYQPHRRTRRWWLIGLIGVLAMGASMAVSGRLRALWETARILHCQHQCMEYRVPSQALLYAADQAEPRPIRSRERAAQMRTRQMTRKPQCLLELERRVPSINFFTSRGCQQQVVIWMHRSVLAGVGEVVLLFTVAPADNPGFRAWVIRPGNWSGDPELVQCVISVADAGTAEMGTPAYKIDEARWSSLKLYGAVSDDGDAAHFAFQLTVDGVPCTCDGRLLDRRGRDDSPIVELRITSQNKGSTDVRGSHQ